MRINAVNSSENYNSYNRNNNPSFKKLIIDNAALQVIKTMSATDKIEFQRIEKRFSKSKFWDLKLSSIGNEFKEFKFKFINKNDEKKVITDGIYPYNLKGKTISVYSIIYGPENTSLNTIETLNFKSAKRAKELFNNYEQNVLYARNRGYNMSPVESLKMKEVELRMLEEACDNQNGERKVTHISTEYITKSTTGNDLKIKD